MSGYGVLVADWRVERACTNLGAAPGVLAQMVCATAGITLPPQGSAARDVVDTMMGWVAALPPGALASSSRPFQSSLKFSPAVASPPARRVFAQMQELVTGLDRPRLQEVAAGLDVPVDGQHDRNGWPVPGPPSQTAAADPQSWAPALLKNVRHGVCQRLARLGDTLLDLSEFPAAPPLDWMPAADGPGSTAMYTVAGAPQPLLLTLTPATYTPEPVSGQAKPVSGYQLEAGWHEPDGTCNQWRLTRTPSYEIARYRASLWAQAAETEQIRAPGSQLLFRPPSPGDAQTRTLGQFLQFTQRHRGDIGNFPMPHTWPARPHRAPGNPRNSALANLLWANGLAWPDPDSPAWDAAPSSPEFAAFLLAQGVRLDPPAITYLTHLSDPGEGPQPWEDRHTAAMHAVIAQHNNPALTFFPGSEHSITRPASDATTLDHLDDIQRQFIQLCGHQSRELRQQTPGLARQALRAVTESRQDDTAQLLDDIVDTCGMEWAPAITTLRELRSQWLTLAPPATGTASTPWPPDTIRAAHLDAVRLLPRPQRPAAITAIDQWQTDPGYPDSDRWPGTCPDQADFCAALALLAWMARQARATGLTLRWQHT